MQKLFFEYLILFRQLSLPGVGTIFLERSPAKLDFGNKRILPPVFSFRLDTGHDQPTKKIIEWISLSFGISDWNATKSLNEFSFELKNILAAEGKFNWENVGTFRRDEKGNLALDAATLTFMSDTPVIAEKVMRENAGHTLIVGEQERSSAEMEAWLAEPKEKKDYTWIIALILTGLSIIIAGWYITDKGFTASATGNQSVIKPK